MSTTNELAAWLDYTRIVSDVLPIDEAAEREVDAVMRRLDRDARPVKSTKLLPRKATP